MRLQVKTNDGEVDFIVLKKCVSVCYIIHNKKCRLGGGAGWVERKVVQTESKMPFEFNFFFFFFPFIFCIF